MKLALSWEATVPFRSRSSGPTRVAQSPARPSITDHQTEVPRTAPDQASAALGSYARRTIKLPRPSALTGYVGTLDTAGGWSTVPSRANREPWQGHSTSSSSETEASSQPACGQTANNARYSTAPPGPLPALIGSSGGATTSGECTTTKPPAFASSGTSVSGTARTPATEAGTAWSRAASMRGTQPDSAFPRAGAQASSTPRRSSS